MPHQTALNYIPFSHFTFTLHALFCMSNYFIGVDGDAITLDSSIAHCASHAQVQDQIFLSFLMKMRMRFHRT